MPDELMLKVPEAGRRLGFGRAKSYALVATGELPSVRISERSIRVPVSSLQAFVRRLEEEAGLHDEGAAS